MVGFMTSLVVTCSAEPLQQKPDWIGRERAANGSLALACACHLRAKFSLFPLRGNLLRLCRTVFGKMKQQFLNHRHLNTIRNHP